MISSIGYPYQVQSIFQQKISILTSQFLRLYSSLNNVWITLTLKMCHKTKVAISGIKKVINFQNVNRKDTERYIFD